MREVTKRDLGFFALGAVLCVIGRGISAPELQLEVGQCRFGVERDGVFYQADQHTDNYLRPACAAIGIADKFKSAHGFGWRAWFMKTGNLEARGNVATLDEDAHTSGTCDPATGHHCHWRFDGAGSLKGIGASLTAEVPVYERWSVIAEAGVFFFKSSFSVTITPADYVGASKRGEEHSHWTDQPSPLIGLTVRRERPFGLPIAVYGAVRRYWPAEHRALNLTDYSHIDLMLGIGKEF